MLMKYLFSMIAIIVLCWIAYSVSISSWENDVEGYTGDGKIIILSSGIFSKGYRIDFDLFPLNASYVDTYKLDNIPGLKKSLVIMLSIPNTHVTSAGSEYIKDDVLFIEVTRESGESLIKVNSNLSEWIETSVSNATTDYYFYNSKNTSILEYDDYKGENLFVTVGYTPVKNIKNSSGNFGRLIVRSGGYK